MQLQASVVIQLTHTHPTTTTTTVHATPSHITTTHHHITTHITHLEAEEERGWPPESARCNGRFRARAPQLQQVLADLEKDDGLCDLAKVRGGRKHSVQPNKEEECACVCVCVVQREQAEEKDEKGGGRKKEEGAAAGERM